MKFKLEWEDGCNDAMNRSQTKSQQFHGKKEGTKGPLQNTRSSEVAE